MDGQRWAAGETIVLQGVWRGQLWAGRPGGTVRKIPAARPSRQRPATRTEHVTVALTLGDWVFADHEWDVSTLWLIEPGAWHAVWVSFLPDGRHLGWYVNFQEPYRRTKSGIQAM